MISENNLPISEFQDQDLQLTTVDQVVELDDNELDNVTGGLFGLGYGMGYSSRHGLNLEDSFKFTVNCAAFGSMFTPVGTSLSTPKE